MKDSYDVIIIGGGVIGSACARELSRYRLSIAVLEKENDLCRGASGRNSGVLHAGFNNRPGSLMAELCVEGCAGFQQVAEELSVPFRRTGKLVVGFDEEDRRQLLALIAQGKANGVPGLALVDKARMRELAPFVEGEFAMWSPSTGILDPFQLTLGLAENAAANGVRYHLSREVSAIKDRGTSYAVLTASGEAFQSRWVVNCAGIHSDRIAAILGTSCYEIHPCRGEYFVLDQRSGPLLPLPAYPVPNLRTGGLGIHLTPTIDGNVLIGPSAEYTDRREDFSSTRPVMDLLLSDGARIFPHLQGDLFIRSYAGMRPKLTGKTEGGYHDFVIERRKETPRAVNLVGIESPGLTAALPIARRVVRLIQEEEPLTPRPDFQPRRSAPPRFRDLSPEEQARLIARDPDYGEVVCRCETITKAQVLQAIRGPLGANSITGIKYRCRASMGRCQGGYCQQRLVQLLAQETGAAPEELLYSEEGSRLFFGKVREND
ncbi:MAG: NAD(P)/FAD-dependent oxidoreductase [Bacillota bacterium]|nr:NAD(P)/FAD-dependent oxidoreductase [Bacillota bacterium]